MTHLCGQWMTAHGILRQRCMWCGEKVLELSTQGSVCTDAVHEMGTWVDESYTPVPTKSPEEEHMYPDGSCVDLDIRSLRVNPSARVGGAGVGGTL